MDTVTCETCASEIRGDNVGAHFEWHQAQDEALAKLREDVLEQATGAAATPDE